MPFVLIPVIITGLLGAGFILFKLNNDVVYLYTPNESAALSDRAQLVENFKTLEGFDPTRTLDLHLSARVIITHNGNGSIWNDNSLREIFSLDESIHKIKTESGISFEDVCAKSVKNECVESEGLVLIKNSTAHVHFPFSEKYFGPGEPPKRIFLGYLLGDVTTDESGYITKVSAIQLVYHLDDRYLDDRSWIEEFGKNMRDHSYNHIKVYFAHSFSIEEELAKVTKDIIPYYAITFAVLATFSIIATMLKDPVRSQPILG